MIDELDELRRANPTSADALEQAVAIERTTLLESLAADSGDSADSGPRSRLRLLGGMLAGRPSSPTRVGYLGAIATAAAVLVGIILVGGDETPTDRDAVDSADQIPQPAERDDDPSQAPASSSLPGTTSATDPAPDPSTAAESTSTSEETSTSQPPPEPTSTQPQPTSNTAEPVDPNPTAPTPPPTIEGPFNRSLDLLVLHYDHAHLDDGHAAVTALEISSRFELVPHVVAGTAADGHSGYVHDFAPVMQAVWGDAWLDARLDRPGATNRSVERWLSTLDAGGRVWVADGGASDFTAEVVREIQRQRPALDSTAAIRIVQHNDRNESETTPENLALLQRVTSYERIDDGNSANGTADLHHPSAALVAAALAGPNREQWSAAFDYLPADELDFSDTVEVLHILGVGLDEVADPDDFAARFMN